MSLSIFPEMSVMFEEQYGQYSNHCNSTDYDMPITSRFRRLLPMVTTAHTKACIEISNEDSGYFIEILRLDEKSNINSKIAEIEELKPNRKNCGGNTSDLQYSVSYLTDENADLRKHIIELEHDVEKQMHEYKTKSQSLQDIEETYKQLIHENSKYIEQLKSEIEELKSQLLEKDSQIFDYEHLEKGVHDGMHGFVNPNSLTSFCKCDTELQGKCMLLQRQHTEDLEEKDSKIKALTDALSQERIKCKNMQECTRDENKFHTAISDGNISRESEHLDVCSDLIEAEYQECHSTEGAYKEESNFSSEGILTEAALETTNDKDTIKQQTSELNNMKEYLAENSKRINDLEAQNEDLLGDINLKIQHIKSLEAEILSHDSEVMDLREEINILNNVGTTGINEAQNVEDEISSLKLAIVKEQEDSNTLQIKLKIFENKYEQLQGQIKTQQSFSMDLEQEKCNLQKELYKLKYQEEKKDSNLEQLKLIKAGENKIESLSHQIEYISKENEKCKTSNDKLMIDILSLRTQLKKMTQENRDNKDTIKQQMNELNKSKEYVMEKTKHIVDLETKNEDLQDDLNLKIRHIKNLEAEMLLENSAICDRREDVTKLNSGRTTGVNETQHLQDEISTLKLTIVKNIEKNNTLQTRLKRCEQNYEQLLGEIELQQSINMKLEQEKCTIEEELDKLKYQTEKRGKNIEQLMLIKASETKIESLSNQIENLRTENEKLKTSNGKLMNDISSLQKHIKENTRSRISELVAVSEKHKGTCDQLMKENISLKDSLENEIKEKTIITNYKDNENVLILQYKDEIASLKMENGATLKSLEQLQKENNVERQALLAKDQKIEDLSNRLATEMSIKVSADERSLENVNEKNRPMNIAAEYEMICSNQWHDAKRVLDDICTEASNDEKIEMLCSVFTISLSEAKKYEEVLMSQIEQMLISPLHESKHISDASQERRQHMPMQLRLLIGDIMRGNADSVDLKAIVSEVKQLLFSKLSNSIHPIDDPVVQIFIEASVRLAWKMVLQKPPMYFDKSGINERWKGDNKQDLFWGSSDPNDKKSKVKYFVHPAVYHGQNLMVKGRVYLSQQ